MFRKKTIAAKMPNNIARIVRQFMASSILVVNVEAVESQYPECITCISDFNSTNTDSVYSGDCLIDSRDRLTKTLDSSQLTRSINLGETSTSFPGHQFRVL